MNRNRCKSLTYRGGLEIIERTKIKSWAGEMAQWVKGLLPSLTWNAKGRRDLPYKLSSDRHMGTLACMYTHTHRCVRAGTCTDTTQSPALGYSLRSIWKVLRPDGIHG